MSNPEVDVEADPDADRPSTKQIEMDQHSLKLAEERGPSGPMARAAMIPIRGYQKLTAGRVSPCRHVPSCSTYALEAVETHGAAKGLMLALWRILRCNPWGSSGYDPVPERKAN